MDFSTLREIIESAGYEVRSYSGRGMYGDYCLGFTTDYSDFHTAADLVNAAEMVRRYYDNVDKAFTLQDFLDVLEDATTDSMGCSTIVYFPRVKWEEY